MDRKTTCSGYEEPQKRETERASPCQQAGDSGPQALPSSLAKALTSPEFIGKISGMCRGPDQEEIAAETLCRLCDPEIGGRYSDSKGSVLQFAAGVRHRIELEWWRSRARYKEPLPPQDARSPPADSPLTILIAEEMRGLVVALLRRLPPQDRELVRRRFGFNNNTSPAMTSTERCRLSRAMHTLREQASELDNS